jgi:hypothetical protein
MSYWHPYCAAGVQIVLLASILCCWCPYCAVGVYIVLLASLLMLVLLLASLYYFWHPCCCIPSAVGAVMFPVLRIRDVYPRSRILIFTHPGSRVLDPGSWIPDPKTATVPLTELSATLSCAQFAEEKV